MASTTSEVVHDVSPFVRVYKDGTVERLVGKDVVPAVSDTSPTGVSSKDVVISEENGVSARLFRPNAASKHQKLPLLIYFHGGGFCAASPSSVVYHRSLSALAAAANVVAVSVAYRKAPEHPLPAAYHDSWAALHWVSSHSGGGGEKWLLEGVDFRRIYLGGDSAGANIVHHLALGASEPGRVAGLEVQGLVMIHPYFWGEDPIGLELEDPARKAMVDNWWRFVCPSEKAGDDPLINPFAEGSPGLDRVGCGRVVVCVAEKDILRDRGRLYYEKLRGSGWRGTAEMVETPGVDHVFHILDAEGAKARQFYLQLASFINYEAPPDDEDASALGRGKG